MGLHESSLDLEYKIDALPEQVLELMTTPSFVVEMREAAGDEEIQVECSGEPPHLKTVLSTRMVGIVTLPKVVKKLFAKRSRIRVELDWFELDGVVTIDYEAAIGDGVGNVLGKAVLSPDGQGSSVSETFTASTKVPLVHKPLLAFIVKTARGLLAGDFKFVENRVRES